MIRQFTMASNGRRFYTEHFFFSNGIFQLLFCIQHNQNSKDQLILFFIITALVLPAIVHQVNVSFLTVHKIITFIIVIIIDYFFVSERNFSQINVLVFKYFMVQCNTKYIYIVCFFYFKC